MVDLTASACNDSARRRPPISTTGAYTQVAVSNGRTLQYDDSDTSRPHDEIGSARVAMKIRNSVRGMRRQHLLSSDDDAHIYAASESEPSSSGNAQDDISNDEAHAGVNRHSNAFVSDVAEAGARKHSKRPREGREAPPMRLPPAQGRANRQERRKRALGLHNDTVQLYVV